MRIKLYMDEDVPVSLAQALVNRGTDVMTTQKAGNTGNSDLEQLTFSTRESRVLFTHNIKDFILLHKDFSGHNHPHAGILVSDQLPIGILLKRTMKLWFTLNRADMKNHLEFLSNWR